ncbi:MAG: deoxyhypusine synthase [Candidatus Woesearchaeota archaeon]|jgi:deoxyhypusine synthase
MNIKDFRWNEQKTVADFVTELGTVGYQSIELAKAAEVMVKMKRDGAKIYLTFTSNMVTSGLRGFFAQLIELGVVDVVVTTVGGIEEDIMKAKGAQFQIGNFEQDDAELNEKGVNRVGNILVKNEYYMQFEDLMKPIFKKLHTQKSRWTPSELFTEIGKDLDDNNSILYQAAKKNIPIFCPAITDGAFGYHLYLYQQTNKDFVIDVVADFGKILFSSSHDDKKGVIALGGSISKHHAILATLLNGGAEYAVYMTTAHKSSGSMSGATTQEAKSWGKVKDDSDLATVIGDVTIMFPLAMCKALNVMKHEKLV